MLNKPIYVGFTVLELSKYLMCDFHYNFMKKKFDADLLFTDTYSLTYETKAKDVYEWLFKYKHFDFSKYKSKFFDSTNKTFGKMEDDFKGIPINKLIGLKSKMYCIVSENGWEVNTEKGINISIDFDEYENVLLNKKLIKHKIKRIKSKVHKIGTYDVCKISLSCFDDKIFILNDGIINIFIRFKRLKFCW